ncbi:MAG: glycosyltransferase [Acidimicrobiia bacterium]|nr:glycosyltransferase [Acidimicrobiia bacterium]
MRILFVSRVDPLPPIGGEEIRAWHFVTGLAAHHQVDVLSFADPGASPERLAATREVVGAWKRIPRPAFSDLQARIRAYPRLVPKFVVWHQSTGFRQALDDAVRGGDYDVVHVYGLALAQYAPPLVGAGQPTVLDLMDSWGVLYRRYAAAAGGLSGWAYRVRARIVERAERRAVGLGTEVVVLSAEDRLALIGRGADGILITAIPNGVDSASHFVPTAAAATSADRLVFVGDMAYRANIEAMQWFATKILPTITAAHPSTKLVIVGKNPAPEVTRLAGDNVIVTGFVEDVRPYLEAASVVVAPIRSGAGIKNKVLEAMAYARPVVTTPVGAEGIPIDDGIHGYLRSTPQSFAEGVIQLLDDARLRLRIGSAARQLMIDEFRWESAVQRLVDVYERAV